MKTHLVLCLLGASLLASCANPAGSSAPTVTDTADPRYLVGTLASWEASQDSGQAVEDPADLLASDTSLTPAAMVSSLARALGLPSVSANADGTVTVTRSGTHWSGVALTKVLVRPKRPTAADFPSGASTLSQTARETWYLGTNTSGTPFADISVGMTWENAAGSIVLQSLTRSGERIGFGTAVPHLLTVDAAYSAGVLVTKTVKHYSGTVDATNLLYTEEFTKTAATADTPASTTITRTSAAGALVNTRTVTESADGSSQTIVRKNSAGVKREQTVRTVSATGWALTHTTYRLVDGSVKTVTGEAVTITTEANTTRMVREVTTADGKVWRVTMDVTVNGNEYTVTKTDAAGATLKWTAVKGADGSWTITPEGGTAVTVADGEAV